MSDDGLAFPMLTRSWKDSRDGDGYVHESTDGMSLRDYFAAQALNGMCGGVPGGHLVPPHTAKMAYEYADAMLAARAK